MKLPFFLSSRDATAKSARDEPGFPPEDAASFDFDRIGDCDEINAEPARPDAQRESWQSKDAAPSGSIGAILVAARRISAEDAQLIVQNQLEFDAPFGETAIRLGLATIADVQYALSKQFAMPCVAVDSDAVDPEVVAAFHPGHELVERLRQLRGQIVLRALASTPALRSIALISSERKVGRSHIAANLATVFAQLGARTLLVDADLNQPRQHQLFRLSNRIGLSSILAQRADLRAVRPIDGLPTLAVLPSGPTPPNPDDLIARPTLGLLLRRLERDFDVILLDTPSWNQGSSARMVTAAARAAVQLVNGGRTGAADAGEVAREVGNVGAHLLGAIMNRP